MRTPALSISLTADDDPCALALIRLQLTQTTGLGPGALPDNCTQACMYVVQPVNSDTSTSSTSLLLLCNHYYCVRELEP